MPGSKPRNARFIAMSVMLASMLFGLSHSQMSSPTFSLSSLSQATIYLDVNQSVLNITAVATGGVPFPPSNNSYAYQWSAQKQASCPGFYTAYVHQLPILKYTPNRTTSNCGFAVQVTDYKGSSLSSSTGKIVANPPLVVSTNINRSSYTIYQGQNTIISLQSPSGGTPPYLYQWFATQANSTVFSSSTANALCAVNPNTLNCVFATNSYTKPGLYEFELSYSDSATIAPTILSKPALIRVLQSNAISTTTLQTTSVASTSTATTSAPSTTTSTIQAVPATPTNNPIEIVTNAGNSLINWLKNLFAHLI